MFQKPGEILGLLLLALSAGCAPGRPIEASRSCAASPEVEAAWRAAFDGLDDKCGYGAACWRSELEAARALRDRHPRELLAHRLFVSEIRWSDGMVPEAAAMRKDAQREYADLARRHPRNPAYPYLLARLEPNQKARRELLRASVALDWSFPWSHHSWVRELAWRPSVDEKREARAHFDAFVRACPEQVSEILALLSDLDDRGAWEAVAPALRRQVTPEGERFADLSALWAAEFKYAEPAEYPALRDRVRGEIDSVAGRHAAPERSRLEVLRAGYAITGDEAGKRAADAEWIERFPCNHVATRIRIENFQSEHGKFSDADEAVARRWLEASSAAMRPWLDRCPNEMVLWQYRLNDLTAWDGASANDVQEAADRVIALVGREGSPLVAKAYLDKGLRLDRVGALIDDAAHLTAEEWSDRNTMGLDDEQLRIAARQRDLQLHEQQALRIRLALARRDLGAARLGLIRLAALVDQARKSASSSRERPTWREAELWRLRGETSTLVGNLQEALGSYARSLELGPEDRKLQRAAHVLYAKIHGGDVGFEAWRDAVVQKGKTVAEEVTRVAHRSLPDLRLQDVAGKTWTSAELRGRALFVNFWTTWCGPCRRELPNVQRLYEKTKGRRDVAVLTVSVDENPGLIQPFLAREKYTFPALVGGPGSYVTWTLGGIPRTYIVDREGMIVQEQLGFGDDAEPWMKKTMASLEAALR